MRSTFQQLGNRVITTTKASATFAIILLTTHLAQTIACDTVKARLLQCCAPRHSIQQHPEATACSEQCSTDRSADAKAFSHQATTTPPALAVGSTSNHVQVGGTDVQAYKVQTTLTPVYLSRHIKLHDSVRTVCLATTTRLSEPFTSRAYAKHHSAVLL